MKITPKLNLNKHPDSVDEHSFIDATNIIYSKDSSTVQTEPCLHEDYANVAEFLGVECEIIYCLPCNTEMLFFCLIDENTIDIVRYNEKEGFWTNTATDSNGDLNENYKYAAKITYSGGYFVCGFSYNNNNLIVSISEYSEDGSLMVPLRVLDLGAFEESVDFDSDNTYNIMNYNQRYNISLQASCPEVLIPAVTCEYTEGTTYKGWYYIFVRYKISDNTYTQWFNTNESIYIDSISTSEFFKYIISDEQPHWAGQTLTSLATVSISDTKDVAQVTFKVTVNHHDQTNYLYYQIGFACITKNYTKGFKTGDFEINNNTFVFNSNSIEEYGIENLILTYTNYYNSNALTINDNRCYIANYLENNDEKEIADYCKANCEFSFIYDSNKSLGTKGENENINVATTVYFKFYENTNTANYFLIPASIDSTGSIDKGTYYYHTLTYCIAGPNNKDSGRFSNHYIKNYSSNTRLTIKFDFDKNKNLFSTYEVILTTYAGNVRIYSLPDGDPSDGDTYKQKSATGSYVTFLDYEGNVFAYVIADSLFDYVYDVTGKKIIPAGSVLTYYGEYTYTYTDSLGNEQSITYTNVYIYEDDDDVDDDGDTIEYYVNRDAYKTYIIDLKHVQYHYYTDYGWGIQITHVNGVELDKDDTNPMISIFDTYWTWRGVDKRCYYCKLYNKETKLSSGSIEHVANSNSIFPDTVYNFFIHFVDKYGKTSLGIQLDYFKEINDCTITDSTDSNINNTNCRLTFVNTKNISNYDYSENYLKLYCSLIGNLPENYIGWFLSYEKVNTRIKFIGVGTRYTDNMLYFYTDALNYEDSLDFGFDSIDIYTSSEISSETDDNINAYLDKDLSSGTTKETYAVSDKYLKVADTFGNSCKSTRIVITVKEESHNMAEDIYYYCILYKASTTDYYNTNNRELIPCTDVIYPGIYMPDDIEVKTKNCFISQNHAIIFNGGEVMNYFYNSAIFAFQPTQSSDIIDNPFFNYLFYAPSIVPVESLNFNNEPVVTYFPIDGLDDDSEDSEKSYDIGNIVECKNTIDLYEQRKYSIYETYPKSLIAYDSSVIYTNDYTKTIRRSNILQDESNNVAWRFFETDNYTILTENKGNVIKLLSVGVYLLAHTQHSMFIFDASNSLKSNDDSTIQLASTDLFDVKYQETYTSELGYGGIQHEWNGIVGEFGYIWYDIDDKRFYKFDEKKLDVIDNDITNFVNKLNHNCYFADDKQRNRLIVKLFVDDANDTNDTVILSYNYKTNTFIARHTYDFYRMWSTKENLYCIGNKVDGETNPVLFFDNPDSYYASNVHIFIDGASHSNLYSGTTSKAIDTFYNIKYMEYFAYNIHRRTQQLFTSYTPIENQSLYYAGDVLRVYNDLVDTGELDVTINDPNNTINDLRNYMKPYWRLGNWHFSALRNNLVNYLSTDDNHITADEASRLHGNWFIVNVIINAHTEQTEFDNLNVKLIDGNKI